MDEFCGKCLKSLHAGGYTFACKTPTSLQGRSCGLLEKKNSADALKHVMRVSGKGFNDVSDGRVIYLFF